MTRNNMLNVRFRITEKESDDELKARFLCQYPRAVTRCKLANPPFDAHESGRLFLVETEDVQALKTFSVDLAQTVGATAEVGVTVDQNWWDDYSVADIDPSFDQINALSGLIFRPEVVPADEILWLNLSLECRYLEPGIAAVETCRQGFKDCLAMSEEDLRVRAYQWLSNFYFKRRARSLSRPATPYTWDYRKEFEADYQRFVAGGPQQVTESFIENSQLLSALCVGPLAVSKLMASLGSKFEKLDRTLADPSGVDNYNLEIEKRNQQLSDDQKPVTRDQLVVLRDTCVSFQQELKAQLPAHWVNWIWEEKVLDALDVRFWVETEKAVEFLTSAFLARYPDVRIEKKVGYMRDVKTYVLAFLVQRNLEDQDDWDNLNEFTGELIDQLSICPLAGGIATPVFSGDWDRSCDGIADFSETNLAWETARLAYDPHAMPMEGLRAALIYDVLVNEENDRYESIKRLESASERYLRAAGFQMLCKYTGRLIGDYEAGTVALDHERFVLNGRQQAQGAFLHESAVLRRFGVTLRSAIRHMDVERPEPESAEFADFELAIESLADELAWRDTSEDEVF